MKQDRANQAKAYALSGVWTLFSIIFLFVATSGSALANSKYAGFVIDAKTGEVLYEDRADEQRYPASLTKMMTLYILFEELDKGRFTLNSQLKASSYAASKPPTKIGIRPGQTIRVEDAIKALCVRSANDVAVVIAENIEGSESKFAQRMTRTAHALGMSSTTFRNANGLPISGQHTTARDMARLGRALHDRFPAYFKFFSTRTFTYKGRTYRNTNHLLGKVRGVNGIKTGYIRASGFNLVTSVEREGRHIIAVVMGGRTGASRNRHMVDLIHRYLDDAKPGMRTAPLVVAKVAPPRRLPEARPVLAFAQAAASAPDAQSAIMAVSAPADERQQLQAKLASGYDPIAARIEEASEVAQLAYVGQSANDPIAILTRRAEAKAAIVAEEAAEDEANADAKIIMPEQRPRLASANGRSVRFAEPKALPRGWHIQIGAAPSEAGARSLLERAQSEAGSVISAASPFTQPVEKDGETLYRARFAGFAGKKEARAACARLKKKSFSCLAVPN
ncbi:D-alanyl-D-alanine carboxypeptidase [Afifella sp. IM 167]|uniref:D-alanyl-D-alanine carboxypeptidase n=1 Tax=Afifella sp. IM 167 TaxID=2033586 RepID=UPI001CCF9FF3|nr:D-alanyl-D-alanine carboxypeptidase [Afifella sp. IM 167]MBZ8132358.1 D-alanyl-D-alanine carboxypeptidase [Afifella sp. IM 167]